MKVVVAQFVTGAAQFVTGAGLLAGAARLAGAAVAQVNMFGTVAATDTAAVSLAVVAHLG